MSASKQGVVNLMGLRPLRSSRVSSLLFLDRKPLNAASLLLTGRVCHSGPFSHLSAGNGLLFMVISLEQRTKFSLRGLPYELA
jgi:hypothetical protein